MPQPERSRDDPRTDARRGDRQDGSRAPGRRPTRQRPAATSALAPAPAPLMPVPDPAPGPSGGDRTGGSRAGRRQHRGTRGDDAAELVYLAGRVPRALRDELHIRAIHEGRPVVELLRDAIRGYLDTSDPAGR